MKWINVQDIAISLEEQYPEIDIFSLTFPKLRSLVISLEDFEDDPNGSNERILEAIQMAWSKERD